MLKDSAPSSVQQEELQDSVPPSEQRELPLWSDAPRRLSPCPVCCMHLQRFDMGELEDMVEGLLAPTDPQLASENAHTLRRLQYSTIWPGNSYWQ